MQRRGISRQLLYWETQPENLNLRGSVMGSSGSNSSLGRLGLGLRAEKCLSMIFIALSGSKSPARQTAILLGTYHSAL